MDSREIKKLIKPLVKECIKEMKENAKMQVSEEEHNDFYDAERCYLCNGKCIETEKMCVK